MIFRMVRWAVATAAVALAIVVVGRSLQVLGGPSLEPWHTFVPDEAPAEAIGGMTWDDWLAREDAVFASVRAEVTDRLDAAARIPENRYFDGSPLHPARFPVDWNRSRVLEPEGPPAGAVVLVHGLTDAPFSLRHVAEIYRARGFVAVLPRMPGHGTVPAGLTTAVWPQWLAATKLAVREAVDRAGPETPLHVVGYSNGGALVVKYAAESLVDPSLARPDQIVLLSPMIGVTRFARFAGLAGWPAVVPAFVGAAWLDILPEFNPFKYNSFPVGAGVQSFRLTQAVRLDLDRLEREGALAGMPPVLAFQSVVDATVRAPALVSGLFARLPANGSELILGDLNRAATLSAAFGRAADAEISRIVPSPPRDYAVTVVTNAGPGDRAAVAIATPAGATEAATRPLGLAYPADVFSLSHVAVPFPVTDGLYGLEPDPADDFGVRIGTLSARGESGVLVLGADMLSRLYSNPFFPLLAERIESRIDATRGR